MANESEFFEEPKFVPVPLTHVNLVPATAEALLVMGPAGTGKTNYLISRAAKLAPTESVLVLCATPDASVAFSDRLREQELNAKNVRVTTPRAFALELLAKPDARAATGRDARLLSPFEERFLFDDLRVTGLDRRRLRSMLAFFRRSLSELGDDDENWLINDEEEGLFLTLKNNLAFTRGIIEPELINLCVNYIRRAEAVTHFDHVLVDDYQLLSRASQYLANMLAKQSICISENPENTQGVFESYPYAAGLDEFQKVNDTYSLVELSLSHSSSASIKIMNALANTACAPSVSTSDDQTNGRLRIVEADHPTGEIDKLADCLVESVRAHGPGVFIAPAHRLWARNIERVLAARGIDTETALDCHALVYQPEATERNRAAKMLVALELAGNPFDGVAWRCWCGFDDYLTNTDGIKTLQQLAENSHLALDGMLNWLSTNQTTEANGAAALSLERIKQAYASGIKLIKDTHELAGEELLRKLASATGDASAEIPQIIKRLTEPFTDDHIPDNDAAALRARALERLALPHFENPEAVHIGSYNHLVGLRPHTIALPGFVNGLTPAHAYFDLTQTSLDDQAHMRTLEAQKLRAIVGACDGDIIVSHFRETSLVEAERLDLKIERIAMRDGRRTARTSPSIFLDEIQ